MMPFTDRSGDRIGVVKLLSFSHKDSALKPYYNCLCDCGKVKKIRLDCLVSGNTVSCGCVGARNRLIGTIKSTTKHGKSKARIYRILLGMKYRCSDRNKSNPQYKCYAGSGISVCAEWDNFEAFEKWSIQNGYSESMTIDRINPRRNYSPKNCRWIPKREQGENRRDTIFIKWKGERKTLRNWAKELGINYYTAYQRRRRSSNPEIIFNQHVR